MCCVLLLPLPAFKFSPRFGSSTHCSRRREREGGINVKYLFPLRPSFSPLSFSLLFSPCSRWYARARTSTRLRYKSENVAFIFHWQPPFLPPPALFRFPREQQQWRDRESVYGLTTLRELSFRRTTCTTIRRVWCCCCEVATLISYS